ncbi:DUF305 domain-containing protein [Nocardiopsis sp. CNT312]|uniref:DUF305 domain-containing protein n=1 Tax=Nocardiopsis sp. CNT312 TaxID=1137268 RepID=UPI0004B21CAE|nr:DUF305 domain-containing protein [Nocardiopsis sp. CNT312]
MGHTSEIASDPDLERSPEAPEENAPGRGGSEGDGGRPVSRGSGRFLPLWIAAVLVVLALCGGYLLGRPSYPLDTSADAGFLRDMSSHHAQAVDMSLIILDKTDDPDLRTIATDIARTQQAQIGIMQGWLTAWGLNSRGTQPPMTWMVAGGHDHGAGPGEVPEWMPGLATPEEMAALEAAEGVEAEVLFLELMIAHHEGGIEMAVAEADLGGQDLVVELAGGMADAQEKEIVLMEGMLADRGVDTNGTPAD